MSRTGFASIGLYNPKNAANVGGVMRATGIFSGTPAAAKLLVIAGTRYSTLTKFPTDTMDAWNHVPMIQVDNIMLGKPAGAVPVAVEITGKATPLPLFRHPENAFYIFGPEDGSIPYEVQERCWHHVAIPTRYCMNLAACVNVVLYDRLAKEMLK